MNWNSIPFKARCMQCHSTFSFKWNLVFSKSIFFFINWLSLIVLNNLEPKLILSRWSWVENVTLVTQSDNLVLWSWWYDNGLGKMRTLSKWNGLRSKVHVVLKSSHPSTPERKEQGILECMLLGRWNNAAGHWYFRLVWKENIIWNLRNE